MQLKISHICAVFLLVPVMINWGCSPKTLAIFFDGVPDPQDTVGVFADQPTQNQRVSNVSNSAGTVNATAVRYFFHMPYKQRECASCHDPNVMGQLLQQPPGLCYQCHDEFSTTYKNLHAPVEAGECLSCHKPHMSENKKLLIQSGQSLCFECHDRESILQAEYHADIGDSNCTDCHNPHGGNERYFLN